MGDFIEGPWGKPDPLEELTPDEGGPIPVSLQPTLGSAVCSDCTFRYNPRPWWKRLFRRTAPEEYFCTNFSRRPVIHPITGGKAYIDVGLEGDVPSEVPFALCVFLNLRGNCITFKPKL